MAEDVKTDDLDNEAEASVEAATEERPALDLTVKVDAPSACERHISVTVSEKDVERYFDEAFTEVMPKAAVRGFRPGRAPRKLVEHRFRKEVSDQVKSNLLMDSMAQVSESQKLSAISEPKIDVGAVEVPEHGPMTFEFDLEVRPEFDMPEWKGVTIERPIRDFTDKDINEQLEGLLHNRGRLAPHDGPAEAGDYIVANLAFKNSDGSVISEATEQTVRIRPQVSFRDGNIANFAEQMLGVAAGETRELEVTVSNEAAKPELRGQKVIAVFEVLEIKRIKLPEMTPEFLNDAGGFDDEAALRVAVRGNLERQMKYQQQQRARQQVTALLTSSANWDLPPDLLRRQSRRELERSVLELRRSGFNDQVIRQHENELRQNSNVATARLLKEHFILERIAEEEKIEDLPEDYDAEIQLIASQSGESPRRVRAQLEKRDLMDILRNQIIERKTIDLIVSHAKFKDVPFQLETMQTEAVDRSAAGEEADIPEAMYSEKPHDPKEAEAPR